MLSSRRVRLICLLGMPAIALLGVTAPNASAAVNLLANGSFGTGTTAGWTCSAGDTIVSSPVDPGSTFALSGTPSNSDFAQCSQVVSVQPNSSYSLTGFVEGDYVFLGDSGTGATDTDNWTPSATSWSELSTTFTTGASTTSVTIYIHGWYAQPTFFADNLTLTGAAGSGGGPPPNPPAAPTGLAVTGTTASSVSLSWTAPAGTVSGYHVLQNGTQVASVTGTTDTITGLTASTKYTFNVNAFNSAGTSPNSAAVTATTSAAGGGGGGGGGSGGLPAHLLMGYWQDFTNGATPLTIAAVPTSYNLIAVAFGNSDATPGQVTFSVDSGLSAALGGYTQQQFINDIKTHQARGQKVILSVGGQNGTDPVDDAASASNFASSVFALIQQYGFNGVDIDLENGVNPTFMASALEQLESDVGSEPDHHARSADRGHAVHRQRLLRARAGHQVHPHDDQHPVLQLRHDERLRRQRLRRRHRELHDRTRLHRAGGRPVPVPGRPGPARLDLGGGQRLRQPVGGQHRARLPGAKQNCGCSCHPRPSRASGA